MNKSFRELYSWAANSFKPFPVSIIVFLFFAAGFLIYANAIFHPFVHDDVVFIEQNPDILRFPSFAELFLRTSSPSVNLPIVNAYYRPFLEILSRVQYRLFGLNPYGYHLFNIVLHILNSLLVYGLVLTLTRRRKMAFILGLLFLVHPVQTEAVASIAGVSNVFFSLFCLLSFLCYCQARRRGARLASVVYDAASLVLFGCSLFIKEQAVVFPLLIVLYEMCFYRGIRGEGLSKGLRIFGFFVLLIGYFILRRMILGEWLTSVFDYPHELLLRLLAIPRLLIMFMGLIVFPLRLHYYRSIDILEPAGWSFFILGIILCFFILVIRRHPRRTRGVLIFGLGWFFVGLAPTLNIIPIINEYSFIMAAEHFLYFPLIGFLIFVGESATEMVHEIPRSPVKKILPGFCGVLILLFMGMTIRANTFWKSEITLFERTLAFEPKFARVHLLVGRAYYFKKNYDRAIAHYTTGLGLMRSYYRRAATPAAKTFYLGFIKGIHFDLAHCYEAKREYPSAAREYKAALTIDPLDSVLYNNLGIVFMNLGRFEEAKKNFLRALKINPRQVLALNNLAVCYLREKNYPKAEESLKKALRIDSHFQEAKENLKRLKQEERN